jgi:hypothetical protein
MKINSAPVSGLGAQYRCKYIKAVLLKAPFILGSNWNFKFSVTGRLNDEHYEDVSWLPMTKYKSL